MIHAVVLALSLAQAGPFQSPRPSPPAPSASPAPVTPVPAPSVVPVTPVPEPTTTPALTAPSAPLTPGPALVASPATIVLARGGQRSVSITNAVGAITVTFARGLVTLVSVDQARDTITLTAPSTAVLGDDVLHVVDQAGSQLDVPIKVALPSATIPANATLRVTGSADPAWIGQQIATFVRSIVQVAPGTQAAIGAPSPEPYALEPGQTAQFTIPVNVPGDGMFADTSSSVAVTVQNQNIGAFVPSRLFYDDDPERITGEGIVYRGVVDSTAAVRLYYYHDSDMAQRRLVILAQAASPDPTQMQVIAAPSGPNIDVMSVGHGATKSYLVNKPLNLGTVVDVPQDPAVSLIDTSLENRQGVAGILDLRILQGGPVTVTVLSVPPNATASQVRALADGPLMSGDGHHRTGVFAPANALYTATYTAGGPDVSVQYGSRGPDPAQTATPTPSNGRDAGDYGVLQTIEFTLTNPTQQTQTVYLYEKPLGGVVRSSFWVNGSLYEAGCARLPIPYQIGLQAPVAYGLEPGMTYRVVVQTMTDGGSNYPLEVGVTSTPPAAPPAISGPAGCFPKP